MTAKAQSALALGTGAFEPNALELCRLADFLTWDGAGDGPLHWISLYDDLLQARFAALVAADPENAILTDGLALLSHRARRQVMRAPRVAEALLAPERDVPAAGAIAAAAIVATLAEEGVVSGLDTPVWSVRGDRRLGQGEANDPPRRLGRTDAVVDTCSPLQRMDDTPHPVLALSPAETDIACGKIDAALEHLAATSAAIGAFWTRTIDVVALRGMTPAPPGLMSTTAELTPRSMRIINAHQPQIGVDLLADGLLHEAIHSIVFMFEHSVTRLLSPATMAARTAAVSPWSGRSLQLLSYAHACIVWYGLYGYWRLAERSEDPAMAARARRQCDMARAGFARRPVSQGLRPFHDTLAPETLALLVLLEQRML